MFKPFSVNQSQTLKKIDISLDISTTLSVIPTSPRHLQRRPQARPFQRRKRLPEKSSTHTEFCYLSPTRQWKDSKVSRQSASRIIPQSFCERENMDSSRVSISSTIDFCRSPTGTQKFTKKEVFGSSYSVYSESRINVEKKRTFHEVDDSGQNYKLQVKQLTRQKGCLEQQVAKLVMENEKKAILIEKVLWNSKRQQLQISRLNDQNQNLTIALDHEGANRKVKEELNHYFEDVITSLNCEIERLLESRSQRDRERDEIIEVLEEKQREFEDLQRYIEGIHSKIKYCEAEIFVLKKKNYELQRNQEDIEKFKAINEKLQKKIEDSQRLRKNILQNDNRRGLNQKNEFLFELSPEK